MIIGRIYDFEAAHVVRECSTKHCKYSIHGHSYVLEVRLFAKGLDKAGMIYDFGLMKREIKALIDSFDHSTIFYENDSDEYKNAIKKLSARWVQLPYNASCEQMARVFFALIHRILCQTSMQNGENGVLLDSVTLKETARGWARFDRTDFNTFEPVKLENIVFSEQVRLENDDILARLLKGEIFVNPKEI